MARFKAVVDVLLTIFVASAATTVELLKDIDDNDLATTCYPLDRALDVLVILDGSGSVGGGTFETQIRMLRRIVEAVEIGSEKTKLAVLQYSGYTKIEFDFNEFSNKDEIKEAVDKIRYISGTTRTGKALKKAQEVFSREHGARVNRKDVAQVVIVVTDGHSQDDPVPPAEALRKAGVTVLAVGIGDYVNMEELLEIAIDTKHMFKNDSLEKFDETFRKIAIGEVCTYAKGSKGIEVVCRNDSVHINVETRRPFQGHFYIKGNFNNPLCSYHGKAKGGKSNEISLRIPLMECGIEEQFIFEPRGLLFETSAILMFHSDYNTERDKAFTVRCFYPDMRFGGPNVTDIKRFNEINPKLLPFKDDPSKIFSIDSVVSSFNVPQMRPPCSYVVRKAQGPGCITEGIQVGEKLIHQWECDTGSVKQEYILLVHSCYVSDGQGQKHLVLDSDGCPIDPLVMSSPIYYKPLLVQMETMAVKFPDKSTLRFRCSLKFCNTRTTDCDAIIPPDCGDSLASNRTRRAAVPASAQVLPQSILNRLKARQQSMIGGLDDFEDPIHNDNNNNNNNNNNNKNNISKELDEDPIVFPPMKHFTFTLNTNRSGDEALENVTSTKKPGVVDSFENFPANVTSSTEKPKNRTWVEKLKITNQAKPRIDANVNNNNGNNLHAKSPVKMNIDSFNNLNRLWQAAVKKNNIPSKAPSNETKLIKRKGDNNSTSQANSDFEEDDLGNGTLSILDDRRLESAFLPTVDEIGEPKKFQLSGLSNQIVASLKFDQIELDSQMIMVHDIEDPDYSASPVDFCAATSKR